ncbi:MAG: response regulator [Pseudomonadota bacterium]
MAKPTLARVLVVEDDPEIGPLTRDMLAREGFAAELARDGVELDRALARQAADLIVLDLMLPGEDGLSICRRLRAGEGPPILMLTARGEDIDRIVGLEIGADDYLAKPFNPRELVARIRAILRRAGPAGPAVRPGARHAFAGFVIDLDAHIVTRDGAEIVLTSGEFALLRAFVRQPRRVLSRDRLMEESQSRATDAFDRTVDVQVSRLRAKLGDDPRRPGLIKTVRNAGYLFAAEVRRLCD